MDSDITSSDIRICFFGDSLVNGARDPECLGWTGRACADARRRGYDVTYYNLGVRGETSADITARWRAEASRRLLVRNRYIKPGVVFSFGVNDTGVIRGGRRVSLEDSIANIARILGEAKGVFPMIMVGPLPIADPGRHSEIQTLSKQFESTCESLGVPYLDLFGELVRSRVWMDEVSAVDGAHPSAVGYAEVANLVLNWSAWDALVGSPQVR